MSTGVKFEAAQIGPVAPNDPGTVRAAARVLAVQADRAGALDDLTTVLAAVGIIDTPPEMLAPFRCGHQRTPDNVYVSPYDGSSRCRTCNNRRRAKR